VADAVDAAKDSNEGALSQPVVDLAPRNTRRQQL
jgi:hypothetical protein